jgi:hypothetical protein
MSRYRLVPAPAQQTILRQHCAHARFARDLAAEQQSWWRPGRGPFPGYCGQAAQLTEARAEHRWLADADVNAAGNIAAGNAVTARGRSPLGGRMNREPQLLAS